MSPFSFVRPTSWISSKSVNLSDRVQVPSVGAKFAVRFDSERRRREEAVLTGGTAVLRCCGHSQWCLQCVMMALEVGEVTLEIDLFDVFVS